eukprot:GFYU01002187.1.p2 GENE.GFYU01002187.1~~GFYU01002187.1.p2  ORF type:complete len:128 (-),score=23.55 GFYU01002187.1:297-680(-)
MADYNEVSVNAQWKERIKKELSTQQLNTEFALNPKKLEIICEKPNLCDPREESTVAVKGDILDLILAPHRTPHEKYSKPVTASHEYGWENRPLTKPSARFHHGRSTCDITQYADAYVTMSGKSPYAK